MGTIEDLVARASAGFRDRFGEEPETLACAPGRINLIGEHTDYNDGYVFPMAIDRHIVVAASSSPDATKVWSESYEEPSVFDTAVVRAGHGWGRFPSGCAWVLGDHGHATDNLNAFVASDLPTGAGVSSSAALELAFLTLWNVRGGLGLTPLELAKLGQECEHRFIGVKCGLMDQMASALGREGHAMLIDTRSNRVEYVPLPWGLTIVLCDTGKPRSLDTSAYNQRRTECEEAARLLGVKSLRDVTPEHLEGTFPQGGGVVYSRARHVVVENQRCVQFASALKDGDLAKLGQLMQASHASLRDDYEVSCPELDAMAEACWESRGCVGARMTGAGFGGACVSLVESERLDAFLGDAEKGYRDRTNGPEPSFLPCQAAQGARVL